MNIISIPLKIRYYYLVLIYVFYIPNFGVTAMGLITYEDILKSEKVQQDIEIDISSPLIYLEIIDSFYGNGKINISINQNTKELRAINMAWSDNNIISQNKKLTIFAQTSVFDLIQQVVTARKEKIVRKGWGLIIASDQIRNECIAAHFEDNSSIIKLDVTRQKILDFYILSSIRIVDADLSDDLLENFVNYKLKEVIQFMELPDIGFKIKLKPSKKNKNGVNFVGRGTFMQFLQTLSFLTNAEWSLEMNE
jgi:hypothetical protein